MRNRQINFGAAISTGVCGVLVFVGFIRLLSYSEGTTGEIVRHSVLAVLCYNPDSLLNAQFFKILATPTAVALIYFFFRWRNAGAGSRQRAAGSGHAHRLDFSSAVLRGILTTVITAHWIGMEWLKFNIDGFYPWSELESRTLNIGVLIISQALSFWGMKYLSFEPLLKVPPQPET